MKNKNKWILVVTIFVLGVMLSGCFLFQKPASPPSYSGSIQNFRVSYVSTNTVELSWDCYNKNITSFTIQKSTDGKKYTDVDTYKNSPMIEYVARAGNNSQVWSNDYHWEAGIENLIPNKIYYFRVEANPEQLWTTPVHMTTLKNAELTDVIDGTVYFDTTSIAATNVSFNFENANLNPLTTTTDSKGNFEFDFTKMLQNGTLHPGDVGNIFIGKYDVEGWKFNPPEKQLSSHLNVVLKNIKITNLEPNEVLTSLTPTLNWNTTNKKLKNDTEGYSVMSYLEEPFGTFREGLSKEIFRTSYTLSNTFLPIGKKVKIVVDAWSKHHYKIGETNMEFYTPPSSNTSYFPERFGQTDTISISMASTQLGRANITYASTSFNTHNDLVATYKATGGSINVYFWKNSSNQVYFDGMGETFNNTTYISTVDGFRMIDNVDTGSNQTPITLVATTMTSNGYPYPQMFIRTSEIIPSINVQGKIYKDVLHVSFAATPNTNNFPPLEVYFAKSVGMIRIKFPVSNSSDGVLTIDLVNFKVSGAMASEAFGSFIKAEKVLTEGMPFFEGKKK